MNINQIILRITQILLVFIMEGKHDRNFSKSCFYSCFNMLLFCNNHWEWEKKSKVCLQTMYKTSSIIPVYLMFFNPVSEYKSFEGDHQSQKLKWLGSMPTMYIKCTLPPPNPQKKNSLLIFKNCIWATEQKYKQDQTPSNFRSCPDTKENVQAK